MSFTGPLYRFTSETERIQTHRDRRIADQIQSQSQTLARNTEALHIPDMEARYKRRSGPAGRRPRAVAAASRAWPQIAAVLEAEPEEPAEGRAAARLEVVPAAGH